MRKTFFSIVLIFFLLIITIVGILSSVGFETKRFNTLISQKISKSNKDVSLKLQKIKFKFDIKNIKLYLETKEPEFFYQNIEIPIREVKTYINFLSLINSAPKIDKLDVSLKEIDISQLKSLLIKTKPSNLNSFVINKVKSGKIKMYLELFYNEDFKLENFITRGEVNNLYANFFKDLKLKETNFNFFADSSDVLIKNINSSMDGVIIRDGNLQIIKNKKIIVKSDFNSKIELDNQNIGNYYKIFKNLNLQNRKTKINADVDNFVNLTFDETYKLINYEYKNKGNVKEISIELEKPIKNLILDRPINSFYLRNTNFNIRHASDDKNQITTSGSYSIDNKDFEKFNLISNFNKKNIDTNLSLEISQNLKVDIINFKKKQNQNAKINLDFNKKKDKLNIKNFEYSEGKNLITFKDLKFNKKQFTSFNELKVKTYEKDILKNDFNIKFGKKILIKGKKYDARNLNKFFAKKSQNSFLKNINASIDIDIKDIETPLSETLKNFKLIGLIERSKFIKISSKGDFGNDKYLDISMKSDKKNQNKYLEIYSDLPQPLLSEYSFFKGLNDGILTFSSIIEERGSTSKLVIENFKVINAPDLVKLLSLADFGGLADLAEGEGLSFDKMEINITSEENLTKINELYAVGPSISVLMDGYKADNGLTSLRGTLVPAKNLNKLLSKIPVIGKIIIPDEIGEGLFGVSFKMKGMPGQIKTTINPIKTLTPRFITRALEKSKDSK